MTRCLVQLIRVNIFRMEAGKKLGAGVTRGERWVLRLLSWVWWILKGEIVFGFDEIDFAPPIAIENWSGPETKKIDFERWASRTKDTATSLLYELSSCLTTCRWAPYNGRWDVMISTSMGHLFPTCSTVVLNRGSGGGSPNLAPNSILMVLVDLDVHQIVSYHYFDHHQPSRGGSVQKSLLTKWSVS